MRNGREIPTEYYSRKLEGAEIRHSTTEWEALAIVAAVKHFFPILWS